MQIITLIDVINHVQGTLTLPFILQGVPKRIRLGFCLISRQPMIGFSNRFFLLKTEIHTVILNTEPFLYD